MAEQQYIYVAAPAVVATPASYAGYTGYSQTSETAYVQPGYTTMVQVPEQSAVGATSYAVPSYQYDAQTQQFSQTAQATVIQNASQTEYATQAAYVQPAGATAYAQQLANQQAALGYAPQTVVYGSQGHLAAVQQAVGQTGTQQAATTPSGSTNAFVHQGQQVVQQQLSMPVGYSNQQLTHGQVQQIQYAIQQTGTAYAAQPQALTSLQTPAYAGSTLVAQQGYAQQGTAAAQPSPFASHALVSGQTQQPPSTFTLQQQQQQQQAAVHQQQAAAAMVAAAYGQSQQAAIYGAQQSLQSAFTPGGQTSLLAAQQQQQQQHQQQLFLGNHGSVLSSPGLAAPAAFMASASAAAGRTLSLPGQNGSIGGSFLQLGSQGQRISGVSQRGFGDRDSFENANHSNSNSSGHQSSGEMEIQRFPDTIFIQGLPDDTTEDMLVQHFGTIGKLKVDTRTGKPRVTLVKDKVTGRPRGEATIGYQDIESVSTAIKMFNNKEFQGRKIRIEVASRKVPIGHQSQTTSAVKRSHPGDDSLDWTCPNPTCNNQNFSWRTECNRCKGPRPEQDSLLKAAAALRRADNGALSRGGLPSAAASSRALGLGLGLRAPASLQAASVASLAAATLRARLTALGSLGMGLGAIPTMPGGPMRGGLRGRTDRRGGRPY